jgi:hypothetical protein
VYGDGNEAEGTFDNDRLHGSGVMIYSNGDRFEGYWNRGLKDGRGSIAFTNGDRYIGMFEILKMGYNMEQENICKPQAAFMKGNGCSVENKLQD